jgi:hypothetical protein
MYHALFAEEPLKLKNLAIASKSTATIAWANLNIVIALMDVALTTILEKSL